MSGRSPRIDETAGASRRRALEPARVVLRRKVATTAPSSDGVLRRRVGSPAPSQVDEGGRSAADRRDADQEDRNGRVAARASDMRATRTGLTVPAAGAGA